MHMLETLMLRTLQLKTIVCGGRRCDNIIEKLYNKRQITLDEIKFTLYKSNILKSYLNMLLSYYLIKSIKTKFNYI